MGISEIVLIGLGLAMDAFAVSICKGLSMKKVNLLLSISIIGIITFILSIISVKIGNKFGDKYQNKAKFVGGLILLGIKILLEHIGILVI